MAYEMKDNSFSLFSNKKKGEKLPTMVGKAKIDGKIYDLSAWSRTSDKAGKWLSGAIKTEWKPPAEQQQANQAPEDDDCPF